MDQGPFEELLVALSRADVRYLVVGGLRYRAVRAGNPSIPYVNAEGWILLKSGSPRPQDLIDVEALRRL
jgi:hypothetical protein